MAPDISDIHILVQSRARICEGGVGVVQARIRILIQRHGARLLVTSGGEEHCPGVSVVLTVHVTVNGLVDGLVSLTPGQLTGHDQLAREEQSAAPLVHYDLRVAADPGVVVAGHGPRPRHLLVRRHRGQVLRRGVLIPAGEASSENDHDSDDGDDDTDGHHGDDDHGLEDVLDVVDAGHVRDTVTVITEGGHLQPGGWGRGRQVKQRRQTQAVTLIRVTITLKEKQKLVVMLELRQVTVQAVQTVHVRARCCQGEGVSVTEVS